MKLYNIQQQGNALILAVVLVAVISTMVGVGTLFNSSIMNNVHRSAAVLEAEALADGALEALFAEWRTLSADRPTNIAGAPPRLPDIEAPDVEGITNGYVQLIKPGMMPSADGTKLEFIPMAPGVQADRALLTGRVLSPVYRGFATINLSTPFGELEMDVSQIYRYEGAAPTDWAIIDFTVPRREEDRDIAGALEIHPGPEMLVGRVHTNGELYTAHQSLKLQDSTTFGNSWENGYHPLNDRGNAKPTKPGYKNDLPPVRGDRQTFFDIDPAQLELGVNIADRDNNPNNDSYREMVKKANPSHPDPLHPPGRDSMRPYDQTAIRIEINSDTNAMRLFNSGGTEVPSTDSLYRTLVKSINPSVNVSTVGNNFTLPNGTFSNVRDNRVSSNQDVKVTNLNLSVLKTALEGGRLASDGTVIVPDLSNYNFNPPASEAERWLDTRPTSNGWNGAIHIEDVTAKPQGTSGNPSKHRGIRITQGGQLPNLKRGDGTFVGFTLITPNPAYILGDFNTGTTYSDSGYSHEPTPSTMPTSNNQSGSNLANFDGNKRIVHGYQDGSISNNPMIPPAAVMADAVTVLSNGWRDSNSTKPLKDRPASGTTVNAAILSGVVPTGARDFAGSIANYSGGAENFPRFLEEWTNKNFVYHGSMIMAFESEQAFFQWGKSNVYGAPRRFWFHEANFRTVVINGVPVNNPPPLMPQRLFSFPRAPKVIERIAFN